MELPEILLIASIILIVVFVILRAKHYFWQRQDTNHDSYLVVAEKCREGRI